MAVALALLAPLTLSAYSVADAVELTVIDVDLLSDAIVSMGDDPTFDLNADTFVNTDDLEIWVKDLKFTWFGDADLNGEFSTKDLVDVFQAGLFETGNPATWGTGDWNADGVFNTGDFVKAFQDGGFEKGPRDRVAAVPEPSVCLLAFFGMIGLFARRRR